ncbi:unnamed protein product [Ilex paraguariensis]|uniref:Pentatricopeptide repeat-containing protein n=1 Tax=Ilex paraguariensis TaxID=185542 RepID=A0ABC8R4A3_9AQUA
MAGMGAAPNVQTYNTQIDRYGQSYQFERCFEILEEMENKGLKLNVLSCDSVINCLCKDGRLLEVEVILKTMEDGRVSTNAQIYNMLIDGHCIGGKMRDASRFFKEMLRNDITLTLVIKDQNFVLGLCKKDKVAEAEEMALQIKSKEHGDVKKAFALHHEMLNRGIHPDRMTYNSLIMGCFKEGKFQEANNIVGDMKTGGLNGFLPSFSICNVLTSGLREEGKLEEAAIICSEMSLKRLGDWSTSEYLAAVKNELPSTFKTYSYQQHCWSCGPANLFRKMKVSLWMKVHVIYSFFLVRKIVAHIVTFGFYCIVLPATVLVPEVEVPSWGAVYILSIITILNAIGTPRSLHLLVFWILFENVISLHRTNTAFIGLLEAGRMSEWVVTENLGDALKLKSAFKAFKRPWVRI